MAPQGRPRALPPDAIDEVRAWADANVGPRSLFVSDIVRTMQERFVVSDTTVRSIVSARWAETRPRFSGALRFHDHGRSLRTMVRFIRSARRTIHVFVYLLTSPRLLKELARARERGVRVFVVVVDGDVTPAKTLVALRTAKIKTVISRARGCAHPKVIVVDKSVGLQGSMNWTEAGLTVNREILVFANGPDATSLYELVRDELLA